MLEQRDFFLQLLWIVSDSMRGGDVHLIAGSSLDIFKDSEHLYDALTQKNHQFNLRCFWVKDHFGRIIEKHSGVAV